MGGLDIVGAFTTYYSVFESRSICEKLKKNENLTPDNTK
jgi:hypothetical protein